MNPGDDDFVPNPKGCGLVVLLSELHAVIITWLFEGHALSDSFDWHAPKPIFTFDVPQPPSSQEASAGVVESSLGGVNGLVV